MKLDLKLYHLRPLLNQWKHFKEQGRIHGNPVADGWAGAVMQKSLGIQKCDGPTYRSTDLPTDTARCRVACPRLKRVERKGSLSRSIRSSFVLARLQTDDDDDAVEDINRRTGGKNIITRGRYEKYKRLIYR